MTKSTDVPSPPRFILLPRELPEDTPPLRPSQRAANQRSRASLGAPPPVLRPSLSTRRDTPLLTLSQRAANQRSRASEGGAAPRSSCPTRRTRPPPRDTPPALRASSGTRQAPPLGFRFHLSPAPRCQGGTRRLEWR